MSASPRRLRAPALLLAAACSVPALVHCGPQLRATGSVKFVPDEGTPRDAAVIIDEEYIGPLGFLAARGVRVLKGEHRITIQKDGYFPFDALVEAGREPVRLDVKLVPIPD